MALTLAFDIGYASIGWCVLSSDKSSKQPPEFLGTGVVTFPTDDCLASQRRDLRRTRRHIRSTRMRIERMKRFLVHRGVLTRADLDKPGHPAPFLLAAAALQGHRTLTAWELWTVLRWYAHNRGYDGNSLWSRGEEESEDTEKLSNARAYMKKYESLEELRQSLGACAPETLLPEFHTMAETVCACLKLNPSKSNKTISSYLPYKTLNAAFPRATVQNEVLILLQKHFGKIPGLDEKTLDLLFTPDYLGGEDRKLLEAADIKLPKRYHGGLLFGQLVPRFDNRIISRCPITWAKIYDEARDLLPKNDPALLSRAWGPWISVRKKDKLNIDEWEKLLMQRTSFLNATNADFEKVDDTIARKLADKFAKVPAAKSKDFLVFRFARILANLKADGRPLDKELRQRLWIMAEKQGRLLRKDIAKAIKEHCGDVPTNIEATFLHPDSEKSLVLDPVTDEVRKASASANSTLYPYWSLLKGSVQNQIRAEWEKGHEVSLAQILKFSMSANELQVALQACFMKDTTTEKGKKSYPNLEAYLFKKKAGPKLSELGLTGRAPYARPVLLQVIKEVREGFDPTRSAEDDEDGRGNKKEHDGVLYSLGVPASRVHQLQNERPLDHLTNNHLVRHRLLILGGDAESQTKVGKPKRNTGQPQRGLLDELIDEFAGGNPKLVEQVVVEVGRDLKEFSGKDNQSIKQEIARKLGQHRTAVRKLEEAGIQPTPKRIRKCRIAIDLNWTCPFTHRTYGPSELDDLEFEHIVPRSKRLSDSMASLALTRKEINSKKGNRTALQFVFDSADDASIVCESKYRQWVKNLKVADQKKYPDDYARQNARKRLLLIERYEDKERTFTPGQMTQSSHLMKMASGVIRRKLPEALIDSMPGIVTAETRKHWDIFAVLGHPDVCGDETMRWVALEDANSSAPLRDSSHAPFRETALVERRVRQVTKMELPEMGFWCGDENCDAVLQPVSKSQSLGYCPKCLRTHRKKIKPKEEIRELTHLHHAVDAATLALAAIYFPFRKYGKDQKGLIWRALSSRKRTMDEVKFLLSLGCFQTYQRVNDNGESITDVRLMDLSPEIKLNLTRSLAECRVMQHVPSDRSGLPTDVNPWRFCGWDQAGKAVLEQRSFVADGKSQLREDGTRIFSNKTPKSGANSRDRVFGTKPKNGVGKLAANKSVLILTENFGIALMPECPEMVPFIDVPVRLALLRQRNGGILPPLIRKGCLIRIKRNPPRSGQDYTGVWRVASVKNNDGTLAIDIIRPGHVTPQNGVTWAGMNKTLEALIVAGIEVLPRRYTGHSSLI